MRTKPDTVDSQRVAQIVSVDVLDVSEDNYQEEKKYSNCLLNLVSEYKTVYDGRPRKNIKF